ncbi:hypothetical protein [Streptomyces mobaraensis]|uniref:Uncharacterized protein n=1 Tax=Streptomyces mobaraensis TaxID=35621 RepID=A0A5N5W1E6_STRMB|nr:hypothetical protein [Streptomyces mobaraensis]KAB7835513.1 hypothetical protein FRZ00_26855 [Streptomyces mobaraensis]
MTQTRGWSYEGRELARIHHRLGRPDGGPGRVVSELVPRGFDVYLRIFHPFEATDGSDRTCTWRALADTRGIPFHAELSHRSLPTKTSPSGEAAWLTQSGRLIHRSRRALQRCLAPSTGDQPVFYAYDLAALLAWDVDAPVERRSTLAGLDAVHEAVCAEMGQAVDGPEIWWPQDCSWVVTTDYDLVSTYIGCSTATAKRIRRDDNLEALPVTPQTRVDFYADHPCHLR